MGIHWTGHRASAWAAVISFGYWTTDFLVVQRVLAAKDLRSAKMAPDHRRGLQDVRAVHRHSARPARPGRPARETRAGEAQAVATGGHSYNEVLPLMLARYCGPGLLGLGITALIAGFMSRHGRQRQRLRHGVDLRHLPRLVQARTPPTRTT